MAASAAPFDVEIAIWSCGLGVSDAEQVLGLLPGSVSLASSSGSVPGCAVSGVVAAVGASVLDLVPGDEVVALLPMAVSAESGGLEGGGGVAERCVVARPWVLRRPTLVGHSDAAAALLPGLRAFDALCFRAGLGASDLEGRIVLVCDAASASNHLTTQLALQWGARVVATAASDGAIDFLLDVRLRNEHRRSADDGDGDADAETDGARGGRGGNGAVFGSLRIVDARCESVEAVLADESGGIGADIIIESGELSAVWSVSSLARALAARASAGRPVAWGAAPATPPAAPRTLLSSDAVLRCVAVHGR